MNRMDYAFSMAAVDRSVERRERHEELHALARHADSDWLHVRRDGSAQVATDGSLLLLSGDSLRELPDEWVFLGVRQERLLFASDCVDKTASSQRAQGWMDLRSAATTLDAAQAGILAYARALCVWRSAHRYCGQCGARNRAEAGGHRLRCPECGLVSFPRTDPAIIVAVRHGDRCLLGRQPGWPAGRYSTLAGFVEPGETLEGAIAREVREEAGIDVDECRYAGSQPWPFPASLMLGFEAQARSTDIHLGDELEDARWFDPDNLTRAIACGEFKLPPALSISRWLMDRWHRDVTGEPLPTG